MIDWTIYGAENDDKSVLHRELTYSVNLIHVHIEEHSIS